MAKTSAKAEITGRVSKSPEIKYTHSGKALTTFGVATSRKGKKGEEDFVTEWWNVTAWEELAEKATQYLRKGSYVTVEGRMNQERYTTKDGAVKEVVAITATEIVPQQGVSEDDAATTGGGGDDDDLPF